MKGKHIYTDRASLLFLSPFEKVLLELKRWGGHCSTLGETLCPLPESIMWSEGRNKDKAAAPVCQSHPELHLSWDSEKKKGHYLLPTTRNLFCTCEIYPAHILCCGWWYLWMGSVFPHYVRGLFITLIPEKVPAPLSDLLDHKRV